MGKWSLVVLASVVVASGASCIIAPPDSDALTPPAGTVTTSVTVTAPAGSRTVAEGALVEIAWSVLNDSGRAATVNVIVEGRTSLATKTVVSGQAVGAGRTSQTIAWDTEGMNAEAYRIRVQLLIDGAVARTATATGEITVDGRPTFAFLAPTAPTELPEDGVIAIRWNGMDPEGTAKARLSLDKDQDHASGNEILIHEATLPPTETAETFEWSGNSASGSPVEAGAYFLFVTVDDTVNPVEVIRAVGTIIVPEEPEPVQVGVIEPTTTVEYIAGSPALQFVLGVAQAVEALVDLKFDTDDNHANGNERAVVLQRLVPEDEDTTDVAFAGDDAAGDAVPDGIYRPVVVVSTGTGTPRTVEGDGFVLVRRQLTPLLSAQTQHRTTGAWSVQTPAARPAARERAGLAYDAARELTVVFGGRAATPLDDTWTWDGTDWVETAARGPAARWGAALAYDAEREVVVLFGGTDGLTWFNDTWTWDGTDWTELAPAESPTGRAGHALAYDAEREVVVLFGGENAGGALGDTWQWDGSTWLRRSPTDRPDARHGHVLAYDGAFRQVVLFGGDVGGTASAETWTWNGDNWTERDPETAPAARYGHAATFDATRRVVVLQGGTDGTTAYSDTWTWNGTNWRDAEVTAGAAGRHGHGLAFDVKNRRTVLFGGATGIPLIALLAPATDREVNAGDTVALSWRDDDPTGKATIRLTIDDDAEPGEAGETGEAEREILAGREAERDGVMDTFNWQVPRLDPGVYYVFAYISFDGVTDDHVSVAPARIIVPDPTR